MGRSWRVSQPERWECPTRRSSSTRTGPCRRPPCRCPEPRWCGLSPPAINDQFRDEVWNARKQWTEHQLYKLKSRVLLLQSLINDAFYFYGTGWCDIFFCLKFPNSAYFSDPQKRCWDFPPIPWLELELTKDGTVAPTFWRMLYLRIYPECIFELVFWGKKEGKTRSNWIWTQDL